MPSARPTIELRAAFEQIPALCVYQPWAELIIRGEKTIEVRSWSTAHRGPLWLHAGLKYQPELESASGFSDLFRGGFVGLVTLEAVIPFDELRWEAWKLKHLNRGDYRQGLYAWLLSSARRFEQPVPAGGNMGLFRPSNDELRLLCSQLNLTAATPP